MGDEIAHGFEKTIFHHKYNPDRVIGVYHQNILESPETIKARKYLMDILYALYPEHFTKVHSTGAWQKDKDTQTHLVLKRLELDEKHKFLQKFRFARGNEKEEMRPKQQEIAQSILDSDQYKNFIALLDGLGISHDMTARGGVESTADNYTFNPDGTIRYIEVADPFYNELGRSNDVWLAFDKNKLRRKILNRLIGPEQAQALRNLDRIIELAKELEVKLITQKKKNDQKTQRWLNRRNK